MANEGLDFLGIILGFVGAAVVFILLMAGVSPIALIALILVIVGLMGIKVIRPTHRVIVEFLGKFQKFGGPGFYWIIPGVQKMYSINITEMMVDAARQEIITADNLNATVDAQVYFKVKDDEASVKSCQYGVYNYQVQIVQLARTTLRNIIGTMTLVQANSDRSSINQQLQGTLRRETASWGIEIVRAELKEIQPPQDVQETMNRVVKAQNEKVAAVDFATATETNADGERRASIKKAEGIKQARILAAEGEALAIKLVNEAAREYFKDEAQELRKLEVVENALKSNTKFLIPEGQSLVNVIGDIAGLTRSPEESK